MRPILQGDVIQAARALTMVPAPNRAGLLRQMIDAAELADAYRHITGRAHPCWGGGSLMASAMTRPLGPALMLDDPDHAACQRLVLEALIARDERQGDLAARAGDAGGHGGIKL